MPIMNLVTDNSGDGLGPNLTYDADGQLINDQLDTFTWDTRRHLTALSNYDTASFVEPVLSEAEGTPSAAGSARP